MDLTLDQALQKGIEAQKTGMIHEADQLYTAILKIFPQHPDANHNMGVLAVSLGKVHEALPFFKTALEANQKIDQFWLSYIDALITLYRTDEAEVAFEQAKSNGADSIAFDQLEKKMFEAIKIGETGIIGKQESINKAIELRESGKFDEAIDLLKKIINQFPEDAKLRALLSHCYMLNDDTDGAAAQLDKAKQIDPDMALVGWNEVRLLLKKQKVTKALAIAKNINNRFPDDVEGIGLLGSCLRVQGDLQESVKLLTKAIELNPNYAEALINRGLVFLKKKEKNKALIDLENAFRLKPHIKDIWNILLNLKMEFQQFEDTIVLLNAMAIIEPMDEKIHGRIATCYQILGNFDQAVMAHKKALEIDPNFSELWVNLGSALKELDRLDEAVEAYRKALAINPDFAEAYNNIGVVFKNQGNLVEAIETFNKALSIQPDYAEAHINKGNALRKQSKLQEAIEAYDKALSIQPNYAEAYNNMGVALHEQSMRNDAVEAYKKAVTIKPGYAEAYWNLSGTAENISEAKYWIEQCLNANPNHLNAKLIMTALQFYQGNKAEFNANLKSYLKDHSYMRSFIWTFQLPVLPRLYFDRWTFFDGMVELSKKERPFYEFGVWRAEAFTYLIKTFKKGYGFDTFEGLPEDWHKESSGTYSSDGNIPKVDGGEFVAGKFEDTLPDFFARKRPKASIINFDADLYSSTICALKYAQPVIDKHTILIFDEFIINETWEEDEYKALEDFCANNNYSYEVLAVSFFTKQVAVKMIGFKT